MARGKTPNRTRPETDAKCGDRPTGAPGRVSGGAQTGQRPHSRQEDRHKGATQQAGWPSRARSRVSKEPCRRRLRQYKVQAVLSCGGRKMALWWGTTYVVSHECGVRNLKYSRIPGQKTSYYRHHCREIIRFEIEKARTFPGFSRQAWQVGCVKVSEVSRMACGLFLRRLSILSSMISWRGVSG